MPHSIVVYFDHGGMSSMKAMHHKLKKSKYPVDLVVMFFWKDGHFEVFLPKTDSPVQDLLATLLTHTFGVPSSPKLSLDMLKTFIQQIKHHETLDIDPNGWSVFGDANLGQPGGLMVTPLFDHCVRLCADNCSEIRIFPYSQVYETRCDAVQYLSKKTTMDGLCLADLVDGLALHVEGCVSEKTEVAETVLRWRGLMQDRSMSLGASSDSTIYYSWVPNHPSKISSEGVGSPVAMGSMDFSEQVLTPNPAALDLSTSLAASPLMESGGGMSLDQYFYNINDPDVEQNEPKKSDDKDDQQPFESRNRSLNPSNVLGGDVPKEFSSVSSGLNKSIISRGLDRMHAFFSSMSLKSKVGPIPPSQQALSTAPVSVPTHNRVKETPDEGPSITTSNLSVFVSMPGASNSIGGAQQSSQNGPIGYRRFSRVAAYKLNRIVVTEDLECDDEMDQKSTLKK